MHQHSSVVCTQSYSYFININGEIIRVGNKDKLVSVKQIPNLINIKMISCGENHVLCLNFNNEVYSFGDNNNKKLGLGHNESVSKNPVKLNLPPIKLISCGLRFSICLTEDGNLYSFGENNYGQLGLGNTKSELTPQLITCLNNIEYAVCGRNRVLCKLNNNTYYAWGYGYYGELGNGSNNAPKIPEQCNNWPDDIISIKCGNFHTIMLSENGKVYSFGYNYSGQLGQTLENSRNIPKIIDTLPEIQRIECGDEHSMCIDYNNQLWLFGIGSSGQLGLKDVHSYSDAKKLAFKHPTLVNIIDISSGGFCTIVKTSSNDIYAFGKNDKSQLGISTPTNAQLTPIQVFQGKEDIWCSTIGKSRQKSARK